VEFNCYQKGSVTLIEGFDRRDGLKWTARLLLTIFKITFEDVDIQGNHILLDMIALKHGYLLSRVLNQLAR
jgi:hypothetical protein